MPDMTAILVIAAFAIAGVAFFLFQRQQNKKEEPAPVPVPVAAPAPDIAALQAALKQAIDKLHASTPVAPAAAPVAAPVAAVQQASFGGSSWEGPQRQPDGTMPVPAAFKPSPWPQNAGVVTSGAAEWTGDFDPASQWTKPGDLGFATRAEMYAARSPWVAKVTATGGFGPGTAWDLLAGTKRASDYYWIDGLPYQPNPSANGALTAVSFWGSGRPPNPVPGQNMPPTTGPYVGTANWSMWGQDPSWAPLGGWKY